MLESLTILQAAAQNTDTLGGSFTFIIILALILFVVGLVAIIKIAAKEKVSGAQKSTESNTPKRQKDTPAPKLANPAPEIKVNFTPEFLRMLENARQLRFSYNIEDAAERYAEVFSSNSNCAEAAFYIKYYKILKSAEDYTAADIEDVAKELSTLSISYLQYIVAANKDEAIQILEVKELYSSISEIADILESNIEGGLHASSHEFSAKKAVQQLVTRFEEEAGSFISAPDIDPEPEPATPIEHEAVAESTIFCTNCGAKVKSTAKFCHKCGASIGGEQTAQATPKPTQPDPEDPTPKPVHTRVPSRDDLTICPKCGTEVLIYFQDCPICGARLH